MTVRSAVGDILVAVREAPEDPAREELLEPAVHDPARERCVEVRAERSLGLPLLDHAAQDREDLAHLADLRLEQLAPSDLAHHDRDERGIVAPGAKQDLRDAGELLGCILVGGLDSTEPSDQLTPVLAEDRLQHVFLGGEIVVEQAVRDPRLLGDVADPRTVVAAAREHAHGRVEDQLSLLLLGD